MASPEYPMRHNTMMALYHKSCTVQSAHENSSKALIQPPTDGTLRGIRARYALENGPREQPDGPPQRDHEAKPPVKARRTPLRLMQQLRFVASGDDAGEAHGFGNGDTGDQRRPRRDPGQNKQHKRRIPADDQQDVDTARLARPDKHGQRALVRGAVGIDIADIVGQHDS